MTLVSTVFRDSIDYIAGTRWSTKRYLNMDLLREMELEKKMAVA